MSHTYKFADYYPVATPRKQFIRGDTFAEFNGYEATEYGKNKHPTCELKHPCGCATRLCSKRVYEDEDYWITVTTMCKAFQLQRLREEQEHYENVLRLVQDDIFRLEHGATPNDLEMQIAERKEKIDKMQNASALLAQECQTAVERLSKLRKTIE